MQWQTHSLRAANNDVGIEVKSVNVMNTKQK